MKEPQWLIDAAGPGEWEYAVVEWRDNVAQVLGKSMGPDAAQGFYHDAHTKRPTATLEILDRSGRILERSSSPERETRDE